MLDGIMNALKGYFPGSLIFWVLASAVTHSLWQAVGGGFDVMLLVKFVVSVVAGTLLATVLAGAGD